MSLGLALAGGGLQGIAHIGAIKAFNDLGIKFDYISGTSSGSIFATMYAMGFTTDEMIEFAKNYHKTLTNFEKRKIAYGIISYFPQREIKIEGLISGEKIEEIVKNVASKKGIKNISDIKMPLAIPTVDTISTNECISISKKYDLNREYIDYIYDIPIGKAVRASMSFPGIFTTCNFEKYNFIDGGTKDNLPVQVLKDMGATKTIGLSFSIDKYTPSKNIFDVLLRTVDIFSQKDVRAAQRIADIAIELDTQGTSLLEITNLEQCYQIGYDEIMKHKIQILNLLEKEDK